MLRGGSVYGFAMLFASLGMLATAVAAVIDVPRTLRQTNRGDVVQRMKLSPDGVWTARKAKRSAAPQCTPGNYQAYGTCGCTYTYACQVEISGYPAAYGTTNTLDQCVQLCDGPASSFCNSVNWQYSTGNCYLFTSDTAGTVANSDYASAFLDENVQCMRGGC